MAGTIQIKKSWIAIAIALYALGMYSGSLVQKYYKYYITDRIAKSKEEYSRKKQECAAIPAEGRMVLLVFGQSNSANYGETPWVSGPNVYNFHDGRCFIAQDPLLGADNTGGSPWARFGDKVIASKLFKNVVIASIGVGGTPVRRWTAGGDLHPRITDTLDELAAVGLPVTHLFWHQGEADAIEKTKGDDYQKMFTAMVQSIRDHKVGAPIFAAVATRCRQIRGDTQIQNAQRNLANPQQGIFAGPDTDALGLEFRFDGCHFSAEGLDLHASLWFDVLDRYQQQHAVADAHTAPQP
jgi:hypothetical protein